MTHLNRMNEPAPQIFPISIDSIGVGDGFDLEMDELGFDKFVHSTNDEIPISDVVFAGHPLLPLAL